MPSNPEINQDDPYIVPHRLGELFDVERSTPTDGDVLIYDGATGQWRPGAGGTSGAFPISDSTGTVTATLTPDPVRGTDTADWVKFPSDGAVAAWGIEGDVFPRVIISADPTSFGFAFGDGTYDPTLGATWLYFFDPGIAITGALAVKGPGTYMTVLAPADFHGTITTDDDVIWTSGLPGSAGPVLQAPDGTTHRILVANDGTLSTEVVT